RIDIESIVVHDLRPSCNEILRKLLFRVGAGIDFSEGAQLRVRSEDEVDASGGPFELVGLPVPSFINRPRAIGACRWLPLRAHVEQIHKEVVRQSTGPVSENTVLRISGIRT